jgi:DNA-binding PadR family transcriptional regulator
MHWFKRLSAKGDPTDTNIFCLYELFKDANEVSNRLPSVHYPHIKRCLNAGLVDVDLEKKTLKLTEKGKLAIEDFKQRRNKWNAPPSVQPPVA